MLLFEKNEHLKSPQFDSQPTMKISLSSLFNAIDDTRIDVEIEPNLLILLGLN